MSVSLKHRTGMRLVFCCLFVSLLAPAQKLMAQTVSGCGDTSQEALKAFNYLNEIRQQPQVYGERIGLSLGKVRRLAALHWNPRLSEIAQKRAENMARRNYFAHVDPDGVGPNRFVIGAGYHLPSYYPSDSEANTVESLAAGAPTGNEAIDDLMIDKGEMPPSHRIHLLALASPFDRHTEVGIGVACSAASDYQYYYEVLTAPPEAIATRRTARIRTVKE
ncbi:CAP domain-containing protein [Gloeobacter kilaueensis]|uniref:SCP domain-containing protein n=1 Tax=Gloeobacter kilaueensis (strain ATCC BAA-2537 / CCAP 1431/1 / ULC 316 / JS1) TaxID=1183438 RepID=U5QC46_GLOK1|nr:CAP domain-containing protein [Gloeobacter kilaueensis]AGY56388.1 hypothetical protein GKIL_0141 [Gloeobacter kilaueensis JS1]